MKTEYLIEKKEPRLISWTEEKKLAETQDEWLLEDWIEFGSLAMLTGDPFSGKSCIVAELMAAIARGGDFGRYKVCNCPILLIDLENKPRRIVQRLSRAVDYDDECLDGRYGRIEMPESLLPYDPKKIEAIISQCMHMYDPSLFDEFKPLVVIDTYRSAFDANEMDVETSKKLLYPLQRVAQRTDAAILILHHRPKSGAKYSGQTSIPGALDYMWMWESDIETREAKLSLTGTRGDLSEPMHFRLNEDHRNVYVSDPTTKDVEDLIVQVLQAGELPQKEIVKSVRSLMGDSSPGIHKLRSMITSMADSALIARHGKGTKISYSLFGA